MLFSALIQDIYPFRHGRKKLLRLLRFLSGRITVGRLRRGDMLLLDRFNYIDHQVLLYGGFEVKLIDNLMGLARRLGATTFLDIGANMGLYTLAAARTPGIARLIAFEPDPRNYMQLAGNLFLNGLADRVVALRLALSDQSGKAIFHVQRGRDDNFVSGHSRFDGAGDGFVPIEVEKAPLDHILDVSNETIVVKIDVEGHESSVLEGMTQLIAGNRILLQIEIFPENLDRVRTRLSHLGFSEIKDVPLGGDDYLFANFEVGLMNAQERAKVGRSF